MKVVRLALLLLGIFIVSSIHLEHQSPTWPWITTGVHDSSCFVEGISFINDTHLLESCGQYGQSYFHIMEYDPSVPSLRQTYRSGLFPSSIFGEGSILFPPNNVIYMLTYHQGVVYRFNGSDYTEITPKLQWKQGQGWSLTHNGSHIFVNNGSNLIFVVDADFNILETKFIVKQDGTPMMRINEMEWVHEQDGDYIYSNIWPINTVLKINLSTNKVEKTFDESDMVKDARNRAEGWREEVLNGIAYDRLKDNFIMTGKDWPLFYLTKLDHK